MAVKELRAELEQRLGALAIHTEVVEHPEVRRFCGDSHAGEVGWGGSAEALGRGGEDQRPQR
uniref:Uncharacterized protein n=1 Tax=Neovison vison TaxID=452646 RepID=A0A8C7AD66_NEOVI